MISKNFQPFNNVANEPEPMVANVTDEVENVVSDSRAGETHKTIHLMSEEDRPREKLMAKGVEALTNAELFAILIGGGTRKKTAVELMQDILSDCDDRLRNLNRMTIHDLMSYNGIGEAKALSIIAAAEIGRRRAFELSDEMKQFNDGKAVLDYMRPKVQDLSHEESWVLLLNNNVSLIRCVHLSKGGLTETAIDVRMVLKQALLHEATCIILVHNHPSGNLRPSHADMEITERVNRGAHTLNIKLLDHIIVSDKDYYSFAENGKI